MVDIIVDKDVYYRSKVHSTVIQKLVTEMSSNPSLKKHRAKTKWLEMVWLDHSRYAVGCKKEDDKIVVTMIRQAPPRRIRIRP